MVHTARFLAELKGVDLEEFGQATTVAATRFFALS
jgi:Tat protein secretion system quality control protein TatD with DNase activity